MTDCINLITIALHFYQDIRKGYLVMSCTKALIFGAVQFLNVLILTLLCVLLFSLVKLTELPPVWVLIRPVPKVSLLV